MQSIFMAAWKPIIASIEQIRIIEENWDRCVASKPTTEIIEAAIRWCHSQWRTRIAPHRVYPTPQGTIVFEWYWDKLLLQGEIVTPNKIEWMATHPSYKTEFWESDIK